MPRIDGPKDLRTLADSAALKAALEYFRQEAMAFGFEEAAHFIGCARQSILDVESNKDASAQEPYDGDDNVIWVSRWAVR